MEMNAFLKEFTARRKEERRLRIQGGYNLLKEGRMNLPDNTVFHVIPNEQLEDDVLARAATLFSDHYGVWGPASRQPGSRVRVTPNRLREDYLQVPTKSEASILYASVLVDGVLIGHACACRWAMSRTGQEKVSVCWITQLVVHADFRRRGLATGLLRHLRHETTDCYGIMSSHPAACMAAARAFGDGIEGVSLPYVRDRAQDLLSSSPIPYIRQAKACGSLFSRPDATDLLCGGLIYDGLKSDDLVCGTDSQFFVDHVEPTRVLEEVQKSCVWPLGRLREGAEYLLIVPAKPRQLDAQSQPAASH